MRYSRFFAVPVDGAGVATIPGNKSRVALYIDFTGASPGGVTLNVNRESLINGEGVTLEQRNSQLLLTVDTFGVFVKGVIYCLPSSGPVQVVEVCEDS